VGNWFGFFFPTFLFHPVINMHLIIVAFTYNVSILKPNRGFFIEKGTFSTHHTVLNPQTRRRMQQNRPMRGTAVLAQPNGKRFIEWGNDGEEPLSSFHPTLIIRMADIPTSPGLLQPFSELCVVPVIQLQYSKHALDFEGKPSWKSLFVLAARF